MLRASSIPLKNSILILKDKTTLIVGFALFSMFFGAGNLIFPLSIGIASQDKFIVSGLGLFFTGIFVPVIGLLSVIFSRHDNLIDYFLPLGRFISYIITFSILGLLGPFSVIPRSIMVAASASTSLSFIPANLIKLLICLILAILTINKKNIVELLGKYLTPLLLLGVILIIAIGMNQELFIGKSHISNSSAFFLGCIEGYQTMDLLASLTFALIVGKYLKQQHLKSTNNISFTHLSITSCFICAVLLLITYSGFIILGASHYNELVNVDPSQRLFLIAITILGDLSIPLVSSIIFLACLTTMCALTDIFADFLSKISSIKKSLSVLLTISISYFISLVEFKTLAIYMGYLLKTLYPSLILFTAIKLFRPKTRNIYLNVLFWSIFLVASIF
ncbi:MAG: branched-chain amino acid transport system II carrier protein [Legionellales bacterium]|nr:branched-chain amino acid transport system II carrier protein [Legionellales bacterium]